MISDRTILIIDDEEDIVKALNIRLSSMGYNLLTASDGLSGLEMARKEKPDLILLDIMLPKLDGFKVCRMLKYDEKYKKIPIIMLTAKATEMDQVCGMESGADEYLTKPFDPAKLTQLLDKYLKRINT